MTTFASDLLPDSAGRNLGATSQEWDVFVQTVTFPNGLTITTGSGSPEGVISALVGSLYLRDDGGAATTFYVKESNSGLTTGWAAK